MDAREKALAARQAQKLEELRMETRVAMQIYLRRGLTLEQAATRTALIYLQRWSKAVGTDVAWEKFRDHVVLYEWCEEGPFKVPPPLPGLGVPRMRLRGESSGTWDAFIVNHVIRAALEYDKPPVSINTLTKNVGQRAGLHYSSVDNILRGFTTKEEWAYLRATFADRVVHEETEWAALLWPLGAPLLAETLPPKSWSSFCRVVGERVGIIRQTVDISARSHATREQLEAIWAVYPGVLKGRREAKAAGE
ncbi:MAG: hypothetical protein GC129_01755 [Proteobacteria bacterium]|nr:hypothetical protein [Pseudomonadota bacterium]